MHRRIWFRWIGTASATAALALACLAHAGRASATSTAAVPGIPQVQPAAGTPHFAARTAPAEQIRQIVECGGIMYAVGSFSQIEQGSQTYLRNNAFSFSATAPFTMTTWNPDVNGVVNSITFNSGRCADAYLGGRFTSVAGQRAGNLAEVSTARLGALVRSFGHSANGKIETLASYQHHVLAGGYFTSINGSSADPYLASLDATTGRNDGFLALGIAGHIEFPGVSPNPTKIYNQQISHTGKADLVEGDFTSVAGKRRRQIFMLDLASRPKATLTGWTSPMFDGSLGYPPHGYYYNCYVHEPFYIRAAAWSPDDKTVYLASTGFRPWNYMKGLPMRGLCDTAAAFSASPAGPKLEWINYTGCDSLYSAAADHSAAYFGGHERWSENRDGCNAPGPGAIPAPGMEAVKPATGALVLGPGGDGLYSRGRGFGADDMLVTSAGLWIASDNYEGSQMCDGVQDLAGLCFLPYGS